MRPVLHIGSKRAEPVPVIEPVPMPAPEPVPSVGSAISKAVREVLTLKKGDSKRGDHKKK